MYLVKLLHVLFLFLTDIQLTCVIIQVYKHLHGMHIHVHVLQELLSSSVLNTVKS